MFLAAASHDLRQPVQSLVFFHSALSSKMRGGPLVPLLENMQNGLDAITMLLDGLLDISKLHAGTVEVQPAAFPVSVLFARIEAEFAGRAAERGLGFRLVPSSLWLHSDAALLERLLRNLIDNAFKFTLSGDILIGCRRHGDTVRIDVIDTGTGIPANRQEDIFHEFVQLGNAERDRSKGLGLGLAVVRHLGQLLGHTIEVASRPAQGSRFSVSVPLCRPRNNHRRRTRQAPAKAPSYQGLALVVDDEALVLVGLRTMLEALGWEVVAAKSGPEAVDLLAGRTAPDIIIADYRLRDGETGVSVIRQIHGRCDRPIPALVLTGDTSPDRILECQRSGFRLLHKPVTPQTLEAVLAEMAERAA